MTAAQAPVSEVDSAPYPMPPSEYAVAAERSLQGLFLQMLERDPERIMDGVGEAQQADVRSVEAESALKVRYDQELAELLAPSGRWTVSQRNDRSDTFSPDNPIGKILPLHQADYKLTRPRLHKA